MQILLQLGANQTVFIQFFIFIISISFLTIFVYGPYFKAYDQRLLQTKGADQVAYETQEEVKKIESIFQVRAREINEKLKNVFEGSKIQTIAAISTILNNAKVTAAELTEAARVKIQLQRAGAEKDVQKTSQEVSIEILKKLTGAV